jgi:integrase
MARAPAGQVIERRGKRDTTFALRIRYAGKRHYVRLGRASEGWSQQRAEEELQNVRADIRRGLWRPAEPQPLAEIEEEPTVHVLASEWVERRRHEVDVRTVEFWEWALCNHLLPFFADYRPSQVTVALVERYKANKLSDRGRMDAAIEHWSGTDPKVRGRMPPRPLSNASINKTLKVLAQVLDDAIEMNFVESNVARGKKRWLKAKKPKRTWLELHEVQALLGAGGKHSALVATMMLAGLRVGELCSLRWRDVDLTAGRITVADAKTDAGERVVDVSPLLLEELKLHRADAAFTGREDLVFGTSTGGKRNRSNITRQILLPAITRANTELAKAGRSPIEGVTNHSLRRTFCALLYEAGATPAYVMAQMGHTDAGLALEIYTKVMERKRDTGARMDALIRGADWAQMGTNGAERIDPLSVAATENPPFPVGS